MRNGCNVNKNHYFFWIAFYGVTIEFVFKIEVNSSRVTTKSSNYHKNVRKNKIIILRNVGSPL